MNDVRDGSLAGGSPPRSGSRVAPGAVMRVPFLASIVMHASLVALAIFGLPQLWRAVPEKLPSVTVELVALADEVVLPEPVPEAPPEESAPAAEALEPVPPAPLPEAEAPAPPPPQPEPPAPLPEVAAPPPPPQPAPQPEAKPASAPQEVAAPPLPAAKPEAPPAPAPETQFAEVAESLLLDRAVEETPPGPSFADVEAALVTAVGEGPSPEETATLAALVGRQIAEEWRVPAGAAGAEELIVTIEVALAADGRVVKAGVIEVAGAASGDLEQAARDAVLRAMNRFRYRPFRDLPPDRYDVWRHMIVRFDPSRMLRS